MLSGRKTLATIDAALRSARRQLDHLDRELETTAQALTLTRQVQVRTLRRMAILRLDALERGELVDSLDAADYRAREALSDRENAVNNLEQEVSSVQETLVSLEATRDDLHDDVEAAARSVAKLEATVQAQLDVDPDYQAQLTKARNAQALANAALEKTVQADSVRTEKGKPYESNRLFAYLWQRKFGTSEYRANSISRWLDRWVASLCDYEDARSDYWMLLEIPKRLAEHADVLGRHAESQLTALCQLEEVAAEKAGVKHSQKALADAESRQDAKDHEIDVAEERLRALHERRGRFAAAEDEFIQSALSAITAAMNCQEVSDLMQKAQDTVTPEDDALVRELQDHRDREEDVQQELADHRRLHSDHSNRVTELEGVRRDFKRHRYDDLRSGFQNESLVLWMINEFVHGAVRGDTLWGTLKRHQAYRDIGNAWPDFGSGGAGRAMRHSAPWHWPGGDGGFKLPRSGGFKSRGGFRTGGGI